LKTINTRKRFSFLLKMHRSRFITESHGALISMDI
jgi:hypothetical protein